MHKIVLDTNVIVSGLNFPRSKPAKFLSLIAAGELVNYTSEPILGETRRILSERFSWIQEEVDAAELWLKTFSRIVHPKNRLTVVADDPDNRILECALEAQAKNIITGDHHLLDLQAYRGIKIWTPAEC